MQLYKSIFRPSFSFKYGILVCIYFALSFLGILHHEMWLDEMHHFLLARDSDSLSELYFNARYDGHPLLWNILLLLITRFTHDPFYMQLLHIIISTAAVIIFLRNAPFTDVFKILFVFSYFIFYEYNVISRNYAISVLFLFISLHLICSAKRNYAAIIISLLLLSYTHLFSLICAASLFLITARLYCFDSNKKISGISFIILCTGFIIGFAFILYSIVPPADHFLKQYDTDPYLSLKRIGKAFSIFFKGLFHIPDFSKYHFWNTNLLVDISKNFSIIPSVLCFIIPFLLFHDKPFSLALFYFSSILIALFIFWSPIIAGVRYFGYIFLLLIVSLWLSEYTLTKNLFFSENLSNKISKFNLRFKISFAYAIICLQVISAGIAYSLDLARPFSEGKAVAEFLINKNLSKKTIAVSNQNGGPAVSGYLDKKIFYPETNQLGSFCKWNTTPFMIDQSTLISRIGGLSENDFVLVMNDTVFTSEAMPGETVFSNNNIRIFYLSKFDEGIIRNENYWIYEVKKNNEK
ncbi:MAG TPA: hypothetical protein VJY62_20970 [Bacteroidia bacterium]|nr:hypothetical protein [Bacteroidia bacterium]